MSFGKASDRQCQWEELVIAPAQGHSAPRLAAKSAPADPEQQIASYMTHELRAPLTSIRSALSILRDQLDGRLAPDERQILALAARNTERLGSLIDDILDFGKVRAGKMTMSLEALRPEELVAEAVDSMRSWAVAKGLRLVCVEPEDPLPRVFADRRRTVQVLVNLLSNAIKFTPAGRKVEVIAARGRHEHLGTIAFKVKDSGPGIPRQDLERIFHCFEQSALGAKASQGTGLGLTLAKAMVELQGGRIWAESWQGLGATLVFTLPILQSDMARPVEAYPRPTEYHGLLVDVFRRMNAFVTALFA